MKVSVIVCTYNREDYILDALMSLKDQSADYSNYEVLLIDNNSNDRTPLICMQFAQQKGSLNYHYYKEPKQGLSHARNRGIELATGEIIAFIDDDAVASKHYIQEIIAFFNENEQVGAIGGRIFPKYETQKPVWMPNQLTPLFSIIDLGEKNIPFKSGKYPVGANMAFRKSVFNTCGNFNIALGRTGKNMLGGEEKDIFYRIISHSILVWYAAKPWVYHLVPQSRTTKIFIKQQAIGVGQSERLRTTTSVKQRLLSITKELLKWLATFVLCLHNVLLLSPRKAAMLIAFRWWVSGGLLNIYKVR